MSTEGQKPSSNDLRRHAEIDKLRAETRHADAQTEKLEKETRRPWFRGSLFLQAVTAGLVAVPLLWFYVKEIAVPLYQSENIKLAREFEVSKTTLSKQKSEHEEAVKKLIEDREKSSRELLSKLNDLRGRYSNLEKVKLEIDSSYKRLLAEQSVTNIDRQQLITEYDSLRKSIAVSDSQISGLEKDISDQKSEAINASVQLANELRKLRVTIPSSAVSYEKSYALLIGVSSYSDPSIPELIGVEKDLKLIERSLVPHSFLVTILANPGRRTVMSNLNKIINKATDKDRVVIYWSGHGAEREESGVRRGYLATNDCHYEKAFSDCVPMETIVDVVNRIAAKSTLALIDTSFAGLAFSGTRGLVRLRSEFEPTGSKEIIAASDTTGLAFDTVGMEAGPFAIGFSEAIADLKADFNGDGVVRTSELFQYQSNRVVQLTQGRQIPTYAKLSPTAGEMLFLETNTFGASR